MVLEKGWWLRNVGLKLPTMFLFNLIATIVLWMIGEANLAYLTIAFDISDTNGGADEEKSQKLSYRSVIDGSRPAQRTAVANGLIFDFITVCNRPYYGLMCAQYCAYAAGDHHICDSSGKKVCLPGWTGKDCTIATGDVSTTRIDDITTPSPTKSSSSKSTAARETRRQCRFFTVRSAPVDDIIHDYWISGQKTHAIIMDAELAQ
ncbi:unnamed protein product [Angiostrongylus costaricensis]|uniref:Delta-like protein n=1 Tax=Angiostrongylus costaricensis TaxID=334426 RepID=A0A0R3PUC1_ANGCS|nr:unnamed protein product [Angiostrongylus costaricensis]